MVTCFLVALSMPCLALASPQAPFAPVVGEEPGQRAPVPGATVLVGSVSRADGTPVADAVVVSEAGGLARTQVDGRFRLELVLPPDATELRLTAFWTVGSSTLTARRTTAVRPGGTIPVGDLALSTGGCEPSWLPTFGHYEDVPWSPASLATWDDGSGPSVYVGCGLFVYRWSGDGWDQLPGQLSFGTVMSLVPYDDGQGSKLYAGGDFLQVDGAFARGLARWDGSAWQALQPNAGTAPMEVCSMEVYDDGSGPALFVAGDIELNVLGVPAHDMLRYDGAWSVPGSPPPGQRVRDLEVYDDGQGGGPELYAASIYDGIGVDLARWNGTRWELLAAGFAGPGGQYAPVLKVFDDGLGGGPLLCAAGPFTSIGGVSAHRAAGWNGLVWTELGAGIAYAAGDLAVFDNGTGPGLYASGSGGGVLQRWDGTSWTTEDPALSTSIAVMEVVDDGSGATLYLAAASGKVNRWEADHWAFPVRGLDGRVRALAVFDDGLGGGPALYAGGSFSVAGGRSARGIARWDGTQWSGLGTGLNSGGSGLTRSAYALAVFDDGGGPALYAGGDFINAGGTSARRVARWDGTSWSALGPGFDDLVSALVAHDDGLGGGPALYAGGQFTASGPTALANVARWDGAAWSPLGSGTNGSVLALGVHDDGLGGGPALIAGGSFTQAGGGAASKIARWDGLAWSGLGSGFGGGPSTSIQSLLSWDDGSGPTLWAGGSFSTADGNAATGIARWDGFGWSALASQVSGSVQALVPFDDGTGGGTALYAAGTFGVGSPAFYRVARWDGATWASLDGSLPLNSLGPSALAVVEGEGGVPALILGGSFAGIGGTRDSNIARWQGCASVPPTLACPDSVEATTFGTSGRIVTFEVSATGAGSPAPVVTCVPASGSFFPLGTTVVHCTATDALGNVSTCDFPVHVARRARVR